MGANAPCMFATTVTISSKDRETVATPEARSALSLSLHLASRTLDRLINVLQIRVLSTTNATSKLPLTRALVV